jgi:uncharacterized protein YdbL (DUF1318 family)
MHALFRHFSAGLAVTIMLAAPASAQRDPAYQAARAQGLIGELPTGYLGYVTAPTPEIRRLVEDINIRRRAAYTERAAAANATVEQFAFTSGCNLIAQTTPGERYMAPDGSWRTRTSAPPERDSRCV